MAAGMTLTEVMLSLGILAITMTGIMGLIVSVSRHNQSFSDSRHAYKACQEVMAVVINSFEQERKKSPPLWTAWRTDWNLEQNVDIRTKYRGGLLHKDSYIFRDFVAVRDIGVTLTPPAPANSLLEIEVMIREGNNSLVPPSTTPVAQANYTDQQTVRLVTWRSTQ
jgi:hypothetical protein